MVTCRIFLHGDLPDLTRGRAGYERRLPAPAASADLLASLGIPRCEVGEIRLDGEPAALDARVLDGARLEAWPASPRDLPLPRLLCDLHLGKLVRLLRFCGFDTAWDPVLREPALARLAALEQRALLSRHRALLKRRDVDCALLVRSDRATEQLAEVLRRFRLADRIGRLGRCPGCNGTLAAMPKAAVPVPIPPRTAAWRDDYWLCSGCGQLFWEGTHVAHLRRRIDSAVRLARARGGPAGEGHHSAGT